MDLNECRFEKISEMNQMMVKILRKEWDAILSDIRTHLHERFSPSVSFVIMKNETRWGYYQCTADGDRKIGIHEKLFFDYTLNDLQNVLRHEAAHYIVDQIFGVRNQDSHGEAFKRACQVLGVEASAHYCATSLSSLVAQSDIAQRINKLLVLGESKCNENEAQVAMNKAYALMAKYNIDPTNDKEEDFVVRPLAFVSKKMPFYMYKITSILREYYSAYPVTCYCGYKEKYFEISGLKKDVDIAEYVFYYLLRAGENAWEEFKRNLNGKKGYHKMSYLSGFYDTIKDNLMSEMDAQENANPEYYAIVSSKDKVLKERANRYYGNLKSFNVSSSRRSMGYSEGSDDGKGITIRDAISNNSGPKQRLIG